MKLKTLKNVICTDLKILDHKTGVKYIDVCKTDDVFKAFEDREVIGIRTESNYLLISVK